MTDDARTYDFLEGGGTLEYHPQAPDMSPEQVEALIRARAFSNQNVIDAAAAKTSVLNIQYTKDRAAADQATLELNHLIAVEFAHKWASETDWGLLPVAAKVVKSLVEVAASGGILAPDVASEWSKIKKTVKDTRSPADIQRLVEEAKQSRDYLSIPDGLTPDQAMAANAAADRVLASPDGAEVIEHTQAMASSGDVEAQRGAITLARVAGARVQAGIAPGQPLIPILDASQAALVASLGVQKTGAISGTSDLESVWARFKKWLWTL